ncbi:MAG: arsenite methyltransferase [bacterium]
MTTSDMMKETVKEKYGKIAMYGTGGCGCNCGCSDNQEFNMMADDYNTVEGYVPDADLNLGCGIPTEFANIKQGHTVLDLGSGAGNDAFIASKLVGATGKVIGLDMTEEMIDKANYNKDSLKADNVDFILGEIENMPLSNDTVDVVVSNCVLNLVPDKVKAFGEIHRVLKPGGNFCISDIVLDGELPDRLMSIAKFYTGCVTGAEQIADYLSIIKEAGLSKIDIHKKNEVILPEELLNDYLEAHEIESYINSGTAIYSITISGVK